MDIKDIETLINSKFGGEAITRLSSNKKIKFNGISTGSLTLNYKLSGNPFFGFAYGRIAEFYGPEQSGKTTLLLHCIHECQKLKGVTAFVDAEHALDPEYAATIGVKLDDLLVSQPSCGEEALDLVEALIDAGVNLIGVDSVAALVPQAEIDGDMGDSHMGLQARLMSQAMRKLTGKIARSNSLVIFTNQIRSKIGVMFGSPEVTTGGNALKFYASYRLDIRSPRGGKIEAGKKEGKKKSILDLDAEVGEEIGITTNVKIVKNKLHPPFKRASYKLIYGRGINKVDDAVNFLTESGLFVPVKDKNGKDQLRVEIDGKSYSPLTFERALVNDESFRKTFIKFLKELYK